MTDTIDTYAARKFRAPFRCDSNTEREFLCSVARVCATQAEYTSTDYITLMTRVMRVLGWSANVKEGYKDV